MSAFAARLRVLPRAHNVRVPTRLFHSPFVVLSASSTRFTTPSPSTATPVYEKQEDSSSEPQLSSSGRRTYVVSEPDPSDNPYEVPSGAYPASAPYATFNSATASNPKGTHSSVGSHPHTRTVLENDAGVGASAAVRSVETREETGRMRTKTSKGKL